MSLREDWARRAEHRAAGVPEKRNSLGDRIGYSFWEYATTPTAQPRQTAAVELAAGMLGRVLATATVDGISGISPRWLRDVGRDLVQRGDHLSRITVRDGMVKLIRQSSWHWYGGSGDTADWTVQATETGPSNTATRSLPFEGVIWLDWSSSPQLPYIGRPAAAEAKLTADTAAAAETSMGREASGDVAKIIPAPEGTEGDDSTDSVDNDDYQVDPHAGYRKDLVAAKGSTMLVESMSNNHDMGGNAPDDWKPRRLGPEPPPGFVDATDQAHHRLLGALGVPVGLATDADGTSQREGYRRWWLTVVDPMKALIEHELTAKLERPITLKMDSYGHDQVSRATVLKKLVEAGVPAAVAIELSEITS